MSGEDRNASRRPFAETRSATAKNRLFLDFSPPFQVNPRAAPAEPLRRRSRIKAPRLTFLRTSSHNRAPLAPKRAAVNCHATGSHHGSGHQACLAFDESDDDNYGRSLIIFKTYAEPNQYGTRSRLGLNSDTFLSANEMASGTDQGGMRYAPARFWRSRLKTESANCGCTNLK